VNPRTPVLVGVGAVAQRESDPNVAVEPLALMIRALERAAEDAGSGQLLERADSIRVPRGIWPYTDPGRLIAEAIGASSPRTLLAQIGVLQTTLFGGAAEDILAGRSDIVLVTGGEAKLRSLNAIKAGVAEALTTQPADVRPDVELAPVESIMHPLEIELDLTIVVRQYAMLETALRYAEGLSPAAHREKLAALWAGLSRVAAENPDAWSREIVPAERVASTANGNRMLAYPYTKLHNSQWNVDQAAGLILCSVETARSLGIPEARWVYPLAVAESNHILPVVERAEPARCPGFAITTERTLERSGRALSDVAHLDLYSCFPAAVKMQMRELGIADDRPLTVTGGMAFAGGPLNNYVLQTVVRLAQLLRADPGATGLVTAVSTVVTKQGASLWSSAPGRSDFAYDDVSAEVAKAWRTIEVDADLEGRATIAAYTVVHGHAGAERAFALCDSDDGRRTIASADDPDLLAAMERDEFCGRTVQVQDRSFRPTG
jgi:acetyl-CoA C-acetyltransferase